LAIKALEKRRKGEGKKSSRLTEERREQSSEEL
jgi:hypothetical protein